MDMSKKYWVQIKFDLLCVGSRKMVRPQNCVLKNISPKKFLIFFYLKQILFRKFVVKKFWVHLGQKKLFVLT